MTSAFISSRRARAVLGLALLACSAMASAQLYKWVDASGKTHFSDKPPPANARPATMAGSKVGATTSDMPYALASAMRTYPVTLWTTLACGGCDKGRAYLKSRGIPFAEKTVETARDQALLKAAGGDALPLLVVGSTSTSGYLQSQWDMVLNSTRYPTTNMLPSSYRYPDPVAAAPAAPVPPAPERDATRTAGVEENSRQDDGRRQREEAAARAPRSAPAFQF